MTSGLDALEKAAQHFEIALEKREREKREYFRRLYPNQDVDDVLEYVGIFPSNRYYTITVYYDPAKFPSKRGQEQLLARMKDQYPGREFMLRRLSPEDLSR